MANIVDYLNWRGDITFSQSPINEIDGLMFANLSYVAMENVVPSLWENESILLKDAAVKFWQEQDERRILEVFSLIKMAPFAMRRMAATRRYQNVQLLGYQNSVNPEAESQFSAVGIRMEEGKTFLAFRGTDDTMIGWKENFRMCFETVPAQEKAVDYLNYMSRKCPGKLWLGGHSKGGNLAVYAAAKAKPEIQNRIQGIFNYDGPGFSKTMLNSVGYQRIAHKIRKFVPEASVVGMLLEHDENYKIVTSSEQGFMQHDPVNWRVLGKGFVSIPKRREQNQALDNILHDWIYSLTLEERKELVDTVFQMISESEVYTMNDFGGQRGKQKLWEIYKRIRKSPKQYETLRNVGIQMAEEFSKSLIPKYRQRKKNGETN